MYNRAELSKSLKEAKKSKVSKKVVNTVVDLTGRGYKNPKNKDAAAIKLYTDSIVNPTEKDLMLYADNGVQVRKQPFDESTTYIPGATSIIEVPISDDGGSIKYLTDEEIAEYRAGGYIVDETPYPERHNPANHFAVTDPRSMQKGGIQDGLYTFAGRPGSQYKYQNGNWFISNAGTKNQYIPINDLTGNRVKTLEAGLQSGQTVYTQPLAPQSGPMTSNALLDAKVTAKLAKEKAAKDKQIRMPKALASDNTANMANAMEITAKENAPIAKQMLEEQAKEQAAFERAKWKDYEKMDLGNQMGDRAKAFMVDPLGMASRFLLGEQAYFPGMGDALVNPEDPNYAKYLRALNYTPGELDAYDITKMVNPMYWGASIGSNLKRGNYGTAATEAALTFAPFFPKGSGNLVKQGAGMLADDFVKAGNYFTTQTPLRNAYKYNPLAGRLGEYNRVVGQDAIDDIVESGLVRVNENAGVAQDLGPFGTVYRTTPYPSFGKAKPQQTYADQVISQGKTPYIISTDRPMKASTLGRHGRGTTQFPVDEAGKYMKGFPASEAKVFEFGDPHWLRGYKEVPVELPGSPNTFTRSGLGGMDMSRYEIKNPDYFTQLLNTYDSKALSASNKKFYKDLIASVKKQNGLVTERQYNELQRLKTGNFNFGKKGYDKGGYVDDQITHFQTGGPTYISATNPGAQLGYSPLFDTVTYNPFDVIQNINNPWWKAHEDFHHKQNMEGRMSTYGSVGERPNPYAASSESINTYYDRRESDINNIIDDMIAKNPSLQFIPRDKLRESVKPNGQGQPSFVGAEDLQYSDPTTLEGEARLEEMKFRRDGGHTIDKNDPGNNALELHMFYDKNNIMQNGGKALQKGQIYTYAPNNTGLSQAYYKLDDNNNILVKAEGSSQYVPIKDPTGNRRKTLEYGLTTGSTKLYGTPEQYAKYNKKPSSFNDFFFSKEEALNNIHQDNAAKCLEDAGHNCLSSAFLYYDRHVAPRLGLDNSWTMKEHAKLTSGSKNSNPRYGDVGESWDSWDIAAGLLEGGGKQFYKSSSEQGIAPSAEWWKKQNLPIGTIINAGSTGASVDYGKGLAYNLKKGLIPSNHSAVVIGYDNDGIPYIYDYGHIRKASDPNALINEFGVTNIVAPKEVLNHTYSELKKGNKLKDEVTPFRYNIADAALNAVSDIDEMKPFMQNLQYHKPAIMAALGISNKTYDDYAKRAAAIALTETKGGDDASIRWKGIVPVPSYLTDKIGLGTTQGITQINSDVLFSSPRTTKQLEKLGIYKDSYDPYNPKHIAMATMVMMDDASRVAMANLKKYKTNKQDLDPAAAMYYQWNSPSTLVKGEAQGDNANVKRFMTNYNMIKSLSKQDGGSIQYLSPEKIKMYRDAGYVVIEEPED